MDLLELGGYLTRVVMGLLRIGDDLIQVGGYLIRVSGDLRREGLLFIKYIWDLLQVNEYLLGVGFHILVLHWGFTQGRWSQCYQYS